MGAAAVPIMIAATVASTAMSVKASMDAGAAASAEASAQAKREGDAARGREIERRRALLRALSSENAAAGAAGITAGGSVGGSIAKDIQYATDDLYTDRSNTYSVQSQLLAQGANARRAGKTQAMVSLLDGVQQIGLLTGGKKAPKDTTGKEIT